MHNLPPSRDLSGPSITQRTRDTCAICHHEINRSYGWLTLPGVGEAHNQCGVGWHRTFLMNGRMHTVLPVPHGPAIRRATEPFVEQDPPRNRRERRQQEARARKR